MRSNDELGVRGLEVCEHRVDDGEFAVEGGWDVLGCGALLLCGD